MWARGVPLVARDNSGGRGSRNEGSRLRVPRQVNIRHNPRNILEDVFEASLRGSLILAENVKKEVLIVLELVLRGQELNLTREKTFIKRSRPRNVWHARLLTFNCALELGRKKKNLS